MKTQIDINNTCGAVEVVSSYENTKDFKRLTFKRLYSPVWISVGIEQIKNNRRTEISLEMDRHQLKALISNLQAFYKTI